MYDYIFRSKIQEHVPVHFWHHPSPFRGGDEKVSILPYVFFPNKSIITIIIIIIIIIMQLPKFIYTAGGRRRLGIPIASSPWSIIRKTPTSSYLAAGTTQYLGKWVKKEKENCSSFCSFNKKCKKDNRFPFSPFISGLFSFGLVVDGFVVLFFFFF